MADSYRYVVEFEKVLTKDSGLRGLTIRDRIRFVEKDSAENWIRDVQRFDRGATYCKFNLKEVAC